MEQKQSVRIRRVGTLTFGCMLLVFGILFLIRIFVPGLIMKSFSDAYSVS